MKLAYIGDGNNVTNSLLIGCSLLGIDISVAAPEGYEPDSECVLNAKKFASSSGAKVEILNSPDDAAKGAHVFYTDVWTSMGQEAEAEKRKEIFKNYQINTNLLKLADKNHIVLHCLPAHKGEEITEEAFELHAASIFEQAEKRMHAHMAIMASLL